MDQARTLLFEARAVYYGQTGGSPRTKAEEYQMFDLERGPAHAAQSKVPCNVYQSYTAHSDALHFELWFRASYAVT